LKWRKFVVWPEKNAHRGGAIHEMERGRECFTLLKGKWVGKIFLTSSHPFYIAPTHTHQYSKGPFGSRVLKGRGGEIFNLKCLVQFLEGEGKEGDGSKSF